MEIYRQTAQLLDLPTAAVLTLVQFAAVAAMLAVHAWTVRERETALRLVPGRADRAPAARRRPVGAARRGAAVIVLLIVLPLAVLVERSFDGPGGYGFDLLPRAAAPPRQPTALPGRAAGRACGTPCAYAAAPPSIALVVGGLAAAALTRTARGGWCAASTRC